MKSIPLLTTVAALAAAAVLQVPASDARRKAEVSGADTGAVGKRQPRPLISLIHNMRLCEDNGDCNNAILTYLGIPEQQHNAIASALRATWKTVQAKFVATANVKVIDGVRPVIVSGISKEEAAASAIAVEQKLLSEASQQTAVLISALFESDLQAVLCREYKLDYYSKKSFGLDGVGPGYGPDDPSVLADYQEGKQTASLVIRPQDIGKTKFAGIEVRLADNYVPKTAAGGFKFSCDYKW
jgi:hypothetical protein